MNGPKIPGQVSPPRAKNLKIRNTGGRNQVRKIATGYHHPWYFCRALEAGIRAREIKRIAFPWLTHSGGIDAPALTYRCGGSTGIALAGAHLFPVYPG